MPNAAGRYASPSNPSFERTRALQQGRVRWSWRAPLNSISLAVMANDAPFQVRLVSPPTAQELELLGVITSVSFVVAILAFLALVVATSLVAVRTTLPGRWPVVISVVLFAAYWALEQYWGGSFEATFGPVAHLVSVIIYASFAVVFSYGFSRMCWYFVRTTSSGTTNHR